jgi:hypothetical protein
MWIFGGAAPEPCASLSCRFFSHGYSASPTMKHMGEKISAATNGKCSSLQAQGKRDRVPANGRGEAISTVKFINGGRHELSRARYSLGFHNGLNVLAATARRNRIARAQPTLARL